MVSRKVAESAAITATRELKRLGAHAIDVRKDLSGSGYAVFAYFEKRSTPAPAATVSVQKGGSRIIVPIRIVISPQFGPE
jgi:hypothetical protein